MGEQPASMRFGSNLEAALRKEVEAAAVGAVTVQTSEIGSSPGAFKLTYVGSGCV